jgi:hypothetical protein
MTKLTLLLIGILLAAVGCSNQFQAYSDYDPALNILAYKTYRWPGKAEMESRVNPLLYNELTDKRIREAVDQQLRKNGYRFADSAAELTVHYHITVKDKVIHSADPRMDSYSQYWMEGGRNTFRYEEGTLIVDLMDETNHNLIWRGWAVGVIDDNTVMLSEEEIKEAVSKIFEDYPRRRPGT